MDTEKLYERIVELEKENEKRKLYIAVNTKWVIIIATIYSTLLLGIWGLTIKQVPQYAKKGLEEKLQEMVREGAGESLDELIISINQKKLEIEAISENANEALKSINLFKVVRVGTYTLKGDYPQDPLKVKIGLKSSEGFCFLTEIKGKFAGDGEYVRVYDDGEEWWFEAEIGSDSKYVGATVYKVIYPRNIQ